SARVWSAGDRVLAIAHIPAIFHRTALTDFKERLFRRDAETKTPDARLTQTPVRRVARLLVRSGAIAEARLSIMHSTGHRVRGIDKKDKLRYRAIVLIPS